MKSASQKKDNDDDISHTNYPQDSYSFLVLNGPFNNPLFFCFGIMAFVFQFALLLVMVLSVINPSLRTNDGFGADNPDNTWAAGFLPSNASPLVRTTQILSLLSFLIFADETLIDVCLAIELLPPLFRTRHSRNREPTHWGLLISCTLRFIKGLLAVAAVFLLVMTDTSVMDIVLNFTAVNFISQLDNCAFGLAKGGRFGPRLRREAQRIEALTLPVEIQAKRVRVWYVAAVLPTAVVLLSLTMAIIGYQESPDHWITQTFRVQFQQNTGFQAYSGCYHLDPNHKLYQRYLYTSDWNNAMTSYVGYCQDTREWLFWKAPSNDLYIDEENIIDPCMFREQEVAHSSKTNTFDVATAFSDEWFSVYSTPLDMYFIENEDSLYELGATCGSFVGNGLCDEVFNNFDYEYDGGDCCASTCVGDDCGKSATTRDRYTCDTNLVEYNNCRDPSMQNLTIVILPFEPKDEDEITWWAGTLPGREEWEMYWMPTLTLDCDGIVVYDGQFPWGCNDEYAFENRYIHTMIDPEASSCTITTKNFDKVWDLGYDVEAPFGTPPIQHEVINQFPQNISVFASLQPDLKELDLSGNAFTGTIPTDLGLLATATNITSLRLDKNQLKGSIPTELARINSLERLSLSDNYLSGTLPLELVRLTGLTHLDLDNNQLTGRIPTELALLTALTHLSLGDNNFEGELPKELEAMTNLKVLRFGQNSLHGTIPETLGTLTLLEELDGAQNAFEGALPSSLLDLTNLLSLDLSYNFLDASSLANSTMESLTSLTHLDLGHNLLGGSIPASIAKLTNLLHFDLGGNTMDGDESVLDELLLSMTKLTHLDLHGNSISGSLSAATNRLSSLRFLNLADGVLNGAIPTEIGTLSKLELLDLDDNLLKGTIPTQIGRLLELESLDLGHNALIGSIPPELGALTELQELLLYHNDLEGTIPCQLEFLSQLSILNLNFNNLTGGVPSSVKADLLHVANQKNGQLWTDQWVCSELLEAVEEFTDGPMSEDDAT